MIMIHAGKPTVKGIQKSSGSLPLFLGVANNMKKLRLSTNLKNEKIQE